MTNFRKFQFYQIFVLKNLFSLKLSIRNFNCFQAFLLLESVTKIYDEEIMSVFNFISGSILANFEAVAKNKNLKDDFFQVYVQVIWNDINYY